MIEQRQYLRRCNLLVSTASGAGLDLSDLRIQFYVKKSDAQTPNAADIRIYNVEPNTIARIQREFSRVVLQAGYEANFGVIFDGNIKQVRSGRENGTDSYLDIAAGDGDSAYNFSVINTTLAAGATQADQIDALAGSMASRGVRRGHTGDTGQVKLPRGKALYGMSRDRLRQSAEASNTTWSIQDGKLQFVPRTGVLPGQAIVLSSKTGLVFQPEQTNEGIKARSLLNPNLRVGGSVRISERDVLAAIVPGTSGDAQVNRPPDIASDGLYRVLVTEHSGDTRGNDWYSDITCLDIDSTQPLNNQVRPV